MKPQDIACLEQSPWFDAQWYLAQYPDVEVSGLSAEAHYLTFGESWSRWAGPRFDAGFYLKRYQDVARAGVSPLLHFIRNGEKEGRWPLELSAQRYEELLWQLEQKEKALTQLEMLTRHTDAWEASYAAWALARWYAWQGDWAGCAKFLKGRYDLAERKPDTPATYLLEIEALTRQGLLLEAYARLEALQTRYSDYQDTYLAMANLLLTQQAMLEDELTGTSVPSAKHRQFNEQLRLSHINAMYKRNALIPLALLDPTQPLSLDNLTVPAQPELAQASSLEKPLLVSVIVPVFNAEKHLETALRSLANQTHTAIEVIMVDDASTDVSVAIAEQFCQDDTRFKLLRQRRNQGAYAARNLGLKEANGEYITIHDSDDWSHPQKIEVQLEGLNNNKHWMACCSDMVRCRDNLRFGRWRIEEKDGWVYRNTSSLMLRRSVIETLGFWDNVRCTADTEYLNRIRAAYGAKAFGEVFKQVPLSFCRDQQDSLSQAGPTHLVTQFKGVRFDYIQAAAQWHARAKQPGDLYLSANPEARPFPAPAANLPG
ncbi:MAG TPA: glycosyl transferase family 2 [Halomonas sp.]|nr:glycosyl transferase family 2 [Halomonas sp.]